MRLDNTLLDVDTLLSELKNETPSAKNSKKETPSTLERLQRKIKEHYFNLFFRSDFLN